MPRLAATTIADRRRRILAAAGRCFIRRGIGATSMRDIFDEAGVSSGGTYVHFPSKHAIVEAFITEAQRRDDALILGCVVPGDRAATLRAFLALALADFATPDALVSVRIDVSTWAEALHDRAIARMLRAAAAHTLDVLARMVARADRRTRPRAGDIAIARTLAALVLGTAVQLHLAPDAPAEGLAGVFACLVEPGLAREAS
jgi:AcrR family transcriptional regulator